MQATFQLGDWLVEPELDRLSRQGETVSLRPQVMDLLVFLSDQAGAIVSAEDILAEVWRGRVTTNASVYNCLKELRHALGDDPHEPHYIETIPKRGYRLLIDPAPATRTAPGSLGNTRGLWGLVAGGLALAVIAVILTYRFLAPSNSVEQAPAPDNTIAVLPFRDMSAAGDQGYLADGIAEELLHALGQLHELRVTASSSSFEFRDADEDLRSIGNKLGVAYIVKGSLRKHEQEVRVSAQLVNSRNGLQVWSGEWVHDPAEMLAAQKAIGAEVAAVLQTSLVGIRMGEESIQGWVELDPLVYDDFLMSRSLVRRSSPQSLRDAIIILDGVVEADPDFARAGVLLLEAELNLFWQYDELLGKDDAGYDMTTFEQWLEGMKNEALELVNRHPSLAEAHLLWGRLLRLDQQYTEAEAAFRHALELKPSLAEAHRNIGNIYMAELSPPGRSIDSFRRAVELDPYSEWANLSLISVLSVDPRNEEEMWNAIRRTRAILPWSPRMAQMEAGILFDLGRYADAIDLLEKAQVREHYQGTAGQLANIWFYLGEIARARELSPGYELYRDDPANPDLPDWQRCPGDQRIHGVRGAYVPAYVCSNKRQWNHVIARLETVAAEPEDFLTMYPIVMGHTQSPAFSLALAYQRTGRDDLAKVFAELDQQALDIRTENGSIRGWPYARYRARLLALQGNYDEAMDELEVMLSLGHVSPRAFGNPVYDPIRHHPRFIRLQHYRLELVNAERAKLGLAPLGLGDLDLG